LEEVPQQRADLAVVVDDQNVGGVGHGRAAVAISGLVRPHSSRDHAISLRLKRGVGCNRMLRPLRPPLIILRTSSRSRGPFPREADLMTVEPPPLGTPTPTKGSE